MSSWTNKNEFTLVSLNVVWRRCWHFWRREHRRGRRSCTWPTRATHGPTGSPFVNSSILSAREFRALWLDRLQRWLSLYSWSSCLLYLCLDDINSFFNVFFQVCVCVFSFPNVCMFVRKIVWLWVWMISAGYCRCNLWCFFSFMGNGFRLICSHSFVCPGLILRHNDLFSTHKFWLVINYISTKLVKSGC